MTKKKYRVFYVNDGAADVITKLQILEKSLIE